MSEESKYYTPSIEEFCVGFISEMKYFKKVGREGEPVWISGEQQIYSMAELFRPPEHQDHPKSKIEYLLEQGDIRVKYLDRQDIESERWNNFEHGPEYGDNWKMGGYLLQTWFNNKIPVVRVSVSGVMFFHGEIKNISEFRRLMTQLGITKTNT